MTTAIVVVGIIAGVIIWIVAELEESERRANDDLS